jgi:hypothetical protein
LLPLLLLQAMAAPPAHEPLVAVITTVGCPYCKKTKAALDAAGIPHREYELSEKLEVLPSLDQLRACPGGNSRWWKLLLACRLRERRILPAPRSTASLPTPWRHRRC